MEESKNTDYMAFDTGLKTLDKKLEEVEDQIKEVENDPEQEARLQELKDKKFVLMEQIVASKN